MAFPIRCRRNEILAEALTVSVQLPKGVWSPSRLLQFTLEIEQISRKRPRSGRPSIRIPTAAFLIWATIPPTNPSGSGPILSSTYQG